MAEITPGKAYGFFTDTSVCIGCKACEVACKEWNLLQGNEPTFLDGYDNTGSLDGQNWRYVQLIDNVPDETMGVGQGKAWLMMSDVCKHCQHASCMEVCPTGAWPTSTPRGSARRGCTGATRRSTAGSTRSSC